MATPALRLGKDLEAVADSFVKDLIQKQGFEAVPIQCHVDRQRHHVAQESDVQAFIKSLDQDEAIRFDVLDEEVPDSLVHAEPVAESESVDIDVDAQEPTVLVRCIGKHRRMYFAGIHQRTKRPLFTNEPRLAYRFADHADVIRTVFQFQEPGDLVLEDVFAGLGLTLMAPPPTPPF